MDLDAVVLKAVSGTVVAARNNFWVSKKLPILSDIILEKSVNVTFIPEERFTYYCTSCTK